MPIFGNDHLTWMLESYIDEREGSSQTEETTAMFGNIREYLLKQSEVNSVEGVSTALILLYFNFMGRKPIFQLCSFRSYSRMIWTKTST